MKKLALFISGLAFCLQPAYAQLIFNSLDLFPGTGKSGNPTQLTVSGSYLFFSSTLTSNGTELWKTDGTIINTFMAKDIYPGSMGSNPTNFLDYNGKLLFSATDGITGPELWTSDGTSGGTYVVKDIILGNFGSSPGQFTLCNGNVYFVATTFAEGAELWITDGTTSGTHLVKDVYPGSNFSNIQYPYSFNNNLIFSAEDGVHGRELWFSNGTDTGTRLLKDFSVGMGNGNPVAFTEYNSKVYFLCDLGPIGLPPQALCVTNGTDTGSKKVTPAFYLANTSNFMIVYKNELYFNAPELYKYNGSTTSLVKEFVPGAGGAVLYSPIVMDGKLYFVAATVAEGNELWVSDGTDAGTQLVKDIIPGGTGSNPTNLTVYQHHIYFTATNATGDRQVFQTDGTTTGTVAVAPTGGAANAIDSATFTGFTIYNGSLYYAANYDAIGRELWSLKDTTTYPNSIEITTNPNTFSIYPNPNNGTFTLETNNDFKNGSVSVYDIMGRLIKSENLISKSETISINAPKGVYVVKLQLDDAVLTKRVMVE
jgi:ELWxxDGT repeat protein